MPRDARPARRAGATRLSRGHALIAASTKITSLRDLCFSVLNLLRSLRHLRSPPDANGADDPIV
jgi:hypothetical protein